MNSPDRLAGVPELIRRLSELNEVGIALSQERDIDRLLETILVAAKQITRADGGTLYRYGGGSQNNFALTGGAITGDPTDVRIVLGYVPYNASTRRCYLIYLKNNSTR